MRVLNFCFCCRLVVSSVGFSDHEIVSLCSDFRSFEMPTGCDSAESMSLLRYCSFVIMTSCYNFDKVTVYFCSHCVLLLAIVD